MQEISSIMQKERICVVIPSFHNEGTIANIVRRVMVYTSQIVVVLDGEPEKGLQALKEAGLSPTIVAYKKNRGKGDALKMGFKKAILMGYEYAITIDSDGQHFPEDIPMFIDAFSKNRGAFIIGTRDLNQENMPQGNSFANNFSNFWFHFQTGIELTDTQCGFRMYPLSMMNAGWHVTSRYESELEFLVYAAWRGVKIVSIPVNVYYPPINERVSSFRPIYDFLRITLLNIVLTTGALFYYLPARFIRKCRRRK